MDSPYPTYDVSQFETKEYETKLPPPPPPSSSTDQNTRTENIKDIKYDIRLETILGEMMRHFHMTAWMFPSKNATPLQRQQITEYYQNFGHILPCPKCRNHYQKYVEQHPIDTHNLFQWTVDLHNDINRIEGKPTVKWEDALVGLVRSVASNRDEVEAELKNRENNNSDSDVLSNSDSNDEDSSSGEVSTVTSVVLLSITFVGLSLLLYMAWKKQNKDSSPQQKPLQ